MMDTVLKLAFLDDEVAVFLGDSEDTREISHPMFGMQERKVRFPAFQISRDMWEAFDCPTVIRINVNNVSVQI